MKRLLAGIAIGAGLAGGPLAAQTATPTPTPTATPSQGQAIGYIWDACARITAGATAAGVECGYWERAGTTPGSNVPQNPAGRYEIKVPSTGNACYQLLRSSGAGDTDKENITPGGCLTAGTSVSLPVCGPCRLYIRIATTPTPNTTPLHAYVSVSGDQLIRVYPATPTPTPTP